MEIKVKKIEAVYYAVFLLKFTRIFQTYRKVYRIQKNSFNNTSETHAR